MCKRRAVQSVGGEIRVEKSLSCVFGLFFVFGTVGGGACSFESNRQLALN